ncbi:MarR family winged helix-turn-helix transcriptional regulator [Mesorhizobium sp. 1B3]|uniref:MarR family winged helix-turn-helix transcriptional regulator n=1 Tax=Mesorhizobium sp. 1B3 TaxID=3243599 RepID=UPI003D985983
MFTPSTNRHNFAQLVLSVARLWRRAADKVLDDYGLSHATAMPLVTLSRLGDSTRQGVIAEQLGLEGPSLVRVIDLLLAEGLVTRMEDPTDRRAKILSLTESGRQRVVEIERILGDLRSDLLAEFDIAEFQAAETLLRRLETKLLGQS